MSYEIESHQAALVTPTENASTRAATSALPPRFPLGRTCRQLAMRAGSTRRSAIESQSSPSAAARRLRRGSTTGGRAKWMSSTIPAGPRSTEP